MFAYAPQDATVLSGECPQGRRRPKVLLFLTYANKIKDFFVEEVLGKWYYENLEHCLARFLWLNFSIFFVSWRSILDLFGGYFWSVFSLTDKEFPNNNKRITCESHANHP